MRPLILLAAVAACDGPPQPEPVATAVNAALRARNAGDLDAARRHYSVALELAPGTVTAMSGLGVIDMLEGDVDRGRSRIEAAALLDPSDAAVQANLAIACHYAGDVSCRDDAVYQAATLGYPRMDDILRVVEGRSEIAGLAPVDPHLLWEVR